MGGLPDEYNLAALAVKKNANEGQTDQYNGNQMDGYTYFMGRTNGWIRDFENIFLSGKMGSLFISCWSLNRR
jgi:hypothetical protein